MKTTAFTAAHTFLVHIRHIREKLIFFRVCTRNLDIYSALLVRDSMEDNG